MALVPLIVRRGHETGVLAPATASAMSRPCLLAKTSRRNVSPPHPSRPAVGPLSISHITIEIPAPAADERCQST
ncbi:hypothetical protein CGCF413_v006748 [Colletotrichum fructicola]|nr:hypothetical protein CGCF413_v006748 [Colletotrichum fructicola]